MLLGSLLVAALAVFVVWDSRRLRARTTAPVPRSEMERGYAPGSQLRWQFAFGLALVFVVLGVVQWVEPRHPPFTGRHAWLESWAYAIFGPHGTAYLYLGLGVVIALWGFASIIGSSSGKRSGPNDGD